MKLLWPCLLFLSTARLDAEPVMLKVSKSNFKCHIEQYLNHRNDIFIVSALYYESIDVVYKKTIIFSDSYENALPYCDIINEILSESRDSSGFLIIDIKSDIQYYKESNNKDYSNTLHTIFEKSLIFPKNLVLKKTTYSSTNSKAANL